MYQCFCRLEKLTFFMVPATPLTKYILTFNCVVVGQTDPALRHSAAHTRTGAEVQSLPRNRTQETGQCLCISSYFQIFI